MSLLRWIQASAHHLPMLADESVQMIATSPPFWGLRSYAGEQAVEWPTVEYRPMAGLPPIRIQGCEPGCMHEWVDASYRPSGHSDNGADSSGLQGGKGTQAQTQRSVIGQAYCRHCGGWRGGLGLEDSIERYIGHLILCLREWRRVLRADGTCWVNLSDSYAGHGHRSGEGETRNLRTELFHGGAAHLQQRRNIGNSGLSAKNLCMIPARFALAAQADGWWLRSDIIGAKVAPMPESCKDRPTRSYEHIFLLAKAERYFWDGEAVREQASSSSLARIAQPTFDQQTGGSKDYRNGINPNRSARQALENFANNPGRNLRDVWEWRPQPFAGAHFATWPEKLVETMIRAGSSAHGCCPACGKAWVRVVERNSAPRIDKQLPQDVALASMGHHGNVGLANGSEWAGTQNITTGWHADCACDAGDAQPCIILDPFAGSGTTLRVAARLGRQGIGVDISQTYIEEIAPLRMGAGVQMELSY